MRKLISGEEAIGRVVSKVVDSSMDDYLVIHFGDGTALVIRACGEFSYLSVESDVFSDAAKADLGLFNESEEREYRVKEVARQSACQSENERFEREQYHRLKLKYGEAQ